MNYIKISQDEGTRRWSYDDRTWDVRIKNEIRDEGDFWVYVNNVPWSSLNPRGQGSFLHVFAWDRQDVIYKNKGSDFGSIPFTRDGFLFDMQSPEDAANVLSLLRTIPSGARIFFHTMLSSEDADLNIGTWESSGLIDYLKSQGAQKADQLLEKGTVPYTFIFDKDGENTVEDIANHKLETIDLTSTARARWKEGQVRSVLIPTEEKLERVIWSEQKEPSDVTRLVILGVTQGNRKDTVFADSDQYEIDLSHVSTQLYQHLQLIYESVDAAMKTAPALEYWRVITQPLPDACFVTQAGEFSIVESVHAGEELEIVFDVKNLNSTTMEDVIISYTLIDENYNKIKFAESEGATERRDH